MGLSQDRVKTVPFLELHGDERSDTVHRYCKSQFAIHVIKRAGCVAIAFGQEMPVPLWPAILHFTEVPVRVTYPLESLGVQVFKTNHSVPTYVRGQWERYKDKTVHYVPDNGQAGNVTKSGTFRLVRS